MMMKLVAGFLVVRLILDERITSSQTCPDYAMARDPARFFVVGRVCFHKLETKSKSLNIKGLQIGVGRATWSKCRA